MKPTELHKNIQDIDPIKQNDLDKILFDNFKWNFALKAFNIGVWDYDADQNRVYFSEESKKLIGETEKEFGFDPQDWNDRVHPDDKEKYFKDFKNHLDGKTAIYENISRIKCKDGSYKWIMDKGQILERTQDGKEKRIIGVHVDITDSKENEKALAKSNQIINRQNDKLKNFAHIVTHNLKEHAANFESLLSLYDDSETKAEKEDLVDHIKTVSDSLMKTILSLKDVVSVDTYKEPSSKSLNLSKNIEAVLKLLELEIKQTNTIVYNKVDKRYNINFSKAYLESIIQNLLTNAIKYRHSERTPVIIIDCNESNDNLVITLSDNGIGIDLTKYGSELFGLYRTFHNNTNSEGVGLYLTKNQIEAFDGTIKVDSTVNVGTTFTITLPKSHRE